MDIYINKRGFVIYYLLILFLFINLLFLEVMTEQGKMISMEKLHFEKEKSIMLSESGLEISLSEIYEDKGATIISLVEDIGLIDVNIEVISESEYQVFSLGSCGSARARIEAKVIKTEDSTLIITERKIW